MVEVCLVLAPDVEFSLVHANRGYLVGIVFSSLFLVQHMDISCRAGSVQQAQQSTHLAEGLNPL